MLFSTDISIAENTRVGFCNLEIYASSVSTDRLSEFDLKLRAALERIASQGVDMVRIRAVIDRERRQVGSHL